MMVSLSVSGHSCAAAASSLRTVLEPYIQKQCSPQQPEDDASNQNQNQNQNQNKLIVLRTTKKKVSSAQFSTLLGGEARFKQFIQAADLQEVYAGIELVACEVSVARGGDEQEARQLAQQLEQALSTATGECVYLAVCVCMYISVCGGFCW